MFGAAGKMSSTSAVDLQRKAPRQRQYKGSKRDRREQKAAASKSPANSVANNPVKRSHSSNNHTPPARSQQRGGQDASHLLNFRAPERRRDMGSRPLPARRRGPVVQFDKDRYFGANYRFVVARDQGEDYGIHLAFPDKPVEWSLIREVHVSEESCYNCPICLEPPIAARLTQCGHVYCWPCLKRLLHVAGKHYAPCPICTNIVTCSCGMLKPAVVHAHDPIKVKSQVTMELMRRERGSTVAIRASSLPATELTRLNGELGLPKEKGPGGKMCPMDHAHRDAMFLKILSVDDPKIISERERGELLEALKLCHSSGDLEMLPHIEACLRDLEMHDAAAAAELAEKTAELAAQAVEIGMALGDSGTAAAASSPAAKSCPTMSCISSPGAGCLSPTAACYTPASSTSGNRRYSGSGLNRSGSFHQKVWIDGELLDASNFDDDFEDSEDDYVDLAADENEFEDNDDIEEDMGEADHAENGRERSHSEASSVASSAADQALQEAQAIADVTDASSRALEFHVEGIHFFYQATDGQKVFLHPVSMRCLLEEHGSYLNLPRQLTAQVLDIEMCVQTEELRKRHKALEHVPLSADMRFVEVDVKPFLSKHTLEKLKPKLEERRKLRAQRAKREQREAARAEQKERRLRDLQNPPPPQDLLHGPSLMASMAATQAQFDQDTLDALLLSEDMSPPLPAVLAGAAVGDSACSQAGAAAAGPRWTQMVQEGRAGTQELQVESEQSFPSLCAVQAFPSLGPAAAPSPPKPTAPAASWSPKASSPATTGSWGPQSRATVVGGKGGRVGLNTKHDLPYGGGKGGGPDAGGMFEMDDVEEDDVSAEERQRRREAAADRALESALAEAAASPGASGNGKAKKGRKAGLVVLAWG